VVAAGPTSPTVTLNLALSFKSRAAGRSYAVEVAAGDDQGLTAGFESAGTLTVTSIGAGPPQGVTDFELDPDDAPR
jgi:hypothetical protein